MKKEKHPAWRGGLTKQHILERNSSKTDEWRKRVFERDRYVCQICKKPSVGNIVAHHILPFSTFPSERFNVDNGQTLCLDCHSLVHSGRPNGAMPYMIEHWAGLGAE
jgi:5-methylcytosine-specific restriction endonuclease McrA